MHRIDTPTAQKDKFGAGKNGFTRGNPQTGTPATDLDDDYFDMLQEELAGVVEATGAVLDKSKHDQLLTALRKLLLSRIHPFADIKADGAPAIAEALANLGLKTAAARDVGTAANQIPDMNSFTSNISASSGYQQLPGGLTIQFGTSAIPTGGSATITLPKAAQSRIILTMVTFNGSQGGTPDSIWISATTTTTITLNHYGDNGAITGTWFVLSN